MTATSRSSRFLALPIAALFALAVAGCGGDDEQGKTYGSEPLGQQQKVTVTADEQFDADQQAVVEAIAKFGDATATKDYATICNELFTEDSRKLGGGDCEQFLKVANKDFKDFDIEIESVTIGEDGATATVKSTTTKDGVPAQVPYNLKKSPQGQWQLAILGQ
jgi:ketosteroid isomerase-like protein